MHYTIRYQVCSLQTSFTFPKTYVKVFRLFFTFPKTYVKVLRLFFTFPKTYVKVLRLFFTFPKTYVKVVVALNLNYATYGIYSFK